MLSQFPVNVPVHTEKGSVCACVQAACHVWYAESKHCYQSSTPQSLIYTKKEIPPEQRLNMSNRAASSSTVTHNSTKTTASERCVVFAPDWAPRAECHTHKALSANSNFVHVTLPCGDCTGSV